jgi:hypothetical protein
MVAFNALLQVLGDVMHGINENAGAIIHQ